MDFPWNINRDKFINYEFVKIIKKYHIGLFTLLDSLQPYNSGQEWLGYVMELSNKDKHIEINQISSPSVSSFIGFYTDGTEMHKPWLIGDNLFFIMKNGTPYINKLPGYFKPMRIFASKDHNWVLYFIPLYEGKRIHLIDFISSGASNTLCLVEKLDQLII